MNARSASVLITDGVGSLSFLFHPRFLPSLATTTPAGTQGPAFKRVLMFVDNAGADVVLGMLPLAREFLRLGAEVVLVANSLPAINDITAAELRAVVARAAEYCPILRAARDAAVSTLAACGGHIPPAAGTQLDTSLSSDLPVARGASGHASTTAAIVRTPGPSRALLPPATVLEHSDFQGNVLESKHDDAERSRSEAAPTTPTGKMKKGMFGESYPPRWKDPR